MRNIAPKAGIKGHANITDKVPALFGHPKVVWLYFDQSIVFHFFKSSNSIVKSIAYFLAGLPRRFKVAHNALNMPAKNEVFPGKNVPPKKW
jgi:hypothetical protein